MKLFLIVLIVLVQGIPLVNAQTPAKIPIPTPAQLQWQNAELAALVCIDLHAFDGKVYNQKEARITPVKDYNIFNPP